MAKADVLDILRAKKMDPLEFHFENLWIPPMHFYLTPQDVEELRKIATSVRLSSKIQQKYQMIDDIMRSRGFKRFSAGTNRVVYRCLEDTRFLVKIAVDKVGMQDNPLEYKNQFLLQPFVTKMFYVSPCGTVGFSERVLPVKNKEEFKQIAPDVFDILVNKILGLYVVEDVGTRYFMNWGIRMGFGPVLLDYPYVYKLDGNKLFCNWTNPETGILCDGEIDYDQGFNHLVCTRCRKTYLATNLRDDSIDNKIVIKKGGIQMRILLKKGDQIISEPIPMDDIMKRPIKPTKKSNKLVVGISRPNEEINVINDGYKTNNDTDYLYEKDNTTTSSIDDNSNYETKKVDEIVDSNDTTEDYNTDNNEMPKAKVESKYNGDDNVPASSEITMVIQKSGLATTDLSELNKTHINIDDNNTNMEYNEKDSFISTGDKNNKDKPKRLNVSNFIPRVHEYTNE